MPAYVLARVHVTDWTRYHEYMRLTPETIARHGGRFLVRGGDKETLEGPAEDARVVVLEFPDAQRARAWFRSAEYQAVKETRVGAASAQFVLVDGVAPVSAP